MNAINGAHAEAKRLAEQKYAAYAAEFSQATVLRPALTTRTEAANLRTRSATAEGAYTELESRVNGRLAWLSARDGFTPETPLDANAARAAAEFFAANGERTLDPDAPAPAVKESAQPLKPTPQAPPAPGTPATLEIDYTSAAGFACRLTLSAPTGPAVLESARVAEERLLKFGARPRAAQATAPATASGAGESESADPPKCKYHGGRMKLGKGNKWFCPKKVDDGYCDYTVAG